MTDQQQWAEAVAAKYAPRIAELLGVSGVPAYTIQIRDIDNPGETAGSSVTLDSSWLKKHPNDEGAVVHELVHVFFGAGNPAPGWLQEGLADYTRNQLGLDTEWSHPNREGEVKGGYQDTAAFLMWLERQQPGAVGQVLGSVVNRTFDPQVFRQITGYGFRGLVETYEGGGKLVSTTPTSTPSASPAPQPSDPGGIPGGSSAPTPAGDTTYEGATGRGRGGGGVDSWLTAYFDGDYTWDEITPEAQKRILTAVGLDPNGTYTEAQIRSAYEVRGGGEGPPTAGVPDPTDIPPAETYPTPYESAATELYVSLWGQQPPEGWLQRVKKDDKSLFEIEMDIRSRPAFQHTRVARDETADYASQLAEAFGLGR